MFQSYNKTMFHVINFIAVILVSAAVVYHYIVFDETRKKTKKDIENAKAEAASSIQTVNTSLASTKKELSSEITDTKGTLKQTNTDLQKTRGDLETTKKTTTKLNTDFTSFNKNTNTSLDELKEQDTKLNTDVTNVSTSLNTFFTTLSEQIKTKNLDVSNAVNFKGGKSVHNPNNWGTHFPWSGDGKNYIRGDTELRGDMDLVGSIKMNRKDPGAMIEKSYTNIHTGDRYGVGQFPDGAMRMYTSSEWAPATANLSVALKDGKFKDVVTANTDGSAEVNGMLRVNRTKNDKYPTGWSSGIHGWDVYANGTIATGQNGDIRASMNSSGDVRADGNVFLNGGNNWIIHTPNDNRTSMWITPSSGYNNENWNWGNALKLDANGTMNSKVMCLEDVCINKNQLQAIKTNAKV
jgi:archaellum component FlaC